MTTEEFGDLTPALFDLLLKRKEAQERKEFLRAGLVAAAVYNAAPGEERKAVSPWDFVPGGEPKDEEVDLRKMHPDQQAAFILNQAMKRTYTKR